MHLGSNTINRVSDPAQSNPTGIISGDPHSCEQVKSVRARVVRESRRGIVRERDTGIEPVFQAWEARVEPIN